MLWITSVPTAVGSVSMWFRSKGRHRNVKERDFRLLAAKNEITDGYWDAMKVHRLLLLLAM